MPNFLVPLFLSNRQWYTENLNKKQKNTQPTEQHEQEDLNYKLNLKVNAQRFETFALEVELEAKH